METINRTQENRLRRQLRKKGYRLEKSRKDININNKGGYQIIETNSNTLTYGSDYGLTLQNVEEISKDI